MQIKSSENKKCTKCKEMFEYQPEDTSWVEYGTYSVKVVKCPHCGSVNVIRYVESSGLDLNNEPCYYR